MSEIIGKLYKISSFDKIKLQLFLIESFTGADLNEETVSESSICQECFITIEKYDDLQHQSEKIQAKLASMFQKTHSSSEQVFIKQEPDVDEYTKETLNVVSPSKNSGPSHRNRIGKSKISKNFLSIAKECGVDYNYDAFQRAFFTNAERESYTSRKHNRSEQTPDKIGEDVSKRFQRCAEKIGIDYNVETFQKAFNCSEHEALTNDVNKKALFDEKSDTSKEQHVKRKKIEISDDFRKNIEEIGIDYNLETFQRAFGYTETPENDQTTEETTIESKGSFECQKCPSTFTNRTRYLRHIGSHELKGASIVCEPCEKKFKTDACLQIHLATDHDRSTGPFDCPICFKTFQDRGTLRMHYYIHTSSRVFLCGRCGATYNHKKSFDLHMMCHDDIRPFPCTYAGCSKAFRNSGKLKM